MRIKKKSEKFRSFIEKTGLGSVLSGVSVRELAETFGIAGGDKLKTAHQIVYFRRQQFFTESKTNSTLVVLPSRQLKLIRGLKRGKNSDVWIQRLGLYSPDDFTWLREAIIGNFPDVSEQEVDYHLRGIFIQIVYSIIFDCVWEVFDVGTFFDLELEEGVPELSKNVNMHLKMLQSLNKLIRLRKRTNKLKKQVSEEEIDPVDVFGRLFNQKDV